MVDSSLVPDPAERRRPGESGLMPHASSLLPSIAPIRLLPDEVADRIAAGEVVERPASVVRELLDNAIDAGSTRIAVEVEDGGLGLIRVTDDGRGIAPEQVELAFERHATSKIGGLADLVRVQTLGFRGEALPSIAAAGDVELVTRAAGEGIGVQAVLVDGRVVRHSARPAPPGTSFAVRDLFGRLPARRKFLASAAAETRQVSLLVAHYALAYPATAFSLAVNGRRTLGTAGDGHLRHAFAAVYGAGPAAEMLEVGHEEDAVAVTGLCGPPSLHRGNRSAISIFINGRWVQSRPLVFAVVNAYESQLPGGRHPVAALAISLPGEEVDVNVHPAKAEVRFRDERAVSRAVRHAVSAALDGARAVPWSAEYRVPSAEGAPSPEHPAPSESWTPSAGAQALRTPDLRTRLGVPVPLQPPAPLQATFPLGARGSALGAGAAAPVRDVLPLLRVVGQMGGTYVVTEGPDGIYLLDQHAAHERVTYDRLVARAGTAEAVQPLLEPALAELDVPLAATLEEHRASLEALGLALEPFGETAYLVRAVPAGTGGRDPAAALRALLEQLAGERRVADPFGRAAATVACHASVRAGMALAMEEMRRLVEDLERTASPRTCPHGRPTLIHLGTDAIERQFGRR